MNVFARSGQRISNHLSKSSKTLLAATSERPFLAIRVAPFCSKASSMKLGILWNVLVQSSLFSQHELKLKVLCLTVATSKDRITYPLEIFGLHTFKPLDELAGVIRRFSLVTRCDYNHRLIPRYIPCRTIEWRNLRLETMIGRCACERSCQRLASPSV